MKIKRFKDKIPVKFFLNEEVKIEQNALDELDTFLRTDDSIDMLQEKAPDYFGGGGTPAFQEVAITPDFHKAAGIPVGTTIFTKGFVLPQAIGNDINCGMRLYTTDLKENDIRGNQKKIEEKLRHVFFEGGRNIPMAKKHREALLREGLIGVLESSKDLVGSGIWQYYDREQQEKDLAKVNKMGSFITDETIGLEDFIGGDDVSYDSQIGSIGGGNHFVEIQKVVGIRNAQLANLWGIKEGQIVIMIHTGSVSIGHHSGTHIKETLKSIYPKGMKHPENGIYMLPNSEKYQLQWRAFWSHLHNAANFAFANRLMLGLMVQKSLTEALRGYESKLLYDAPHNYVWEETIDGVQGFLHRKGSCTAKSAEQMQGTPFAYTGEPVFIPGSMGSKSYILAGRGNRESLFSASHGAGRKLSRGESLKMDDKLFREFVSRFSVVTPIDPERIDIRNRPDILKAWEEELKKEAPYAYKEISPIIQSHVDHGMADIVAEVAPILTIKG